MDGKIIYNVFEINFCYLSKLWTNLLKFGLVNLLSILLTL